MNTALLLDTHIALWLDSGSPRLRPATVSMIENCWRAGGTIHLSAVSAWEIALLVDTGRISLDLPVDGWVARFINRPGLAAAPLTPQAAARAYSLLDFPHRDPGDRLLVATAIDLRCPLVSYDERLAVYAETTGRQYGLAVAG